MLSRVKLQVELPVVHPELMAYPDGTVQAPIVDGLAAVAVSVIWPVFATEVKQVPEAVPPVSVQVMPAGLLVTDPLPVLAKATVTVLLSVNVFCATNPDVPPVALK